MRQTLSYSSFSKRNPVTAHCENLIISISFLVTQCPLFKPLLKLCRLQHQGRGTKHSMYLPLSFQMNQEKLNEKQIRVRTSAHIHNVSVVSDRSSVGASDLLVFDFEPETLF